MGAVTVSSSASSTQLGLRQTFSSYQLPLRSTQVLASKTKDTSVVPSVLASTPKDEYERFKYSENIRPLLVDETSSCTLKIDYVEAAAKLKNIYNYCLLYNMEDKSTGLRNEREQKKKKKKKKKVNSYEFWLKKKPKRLSLEERIAMRNSRLCEMVSSHQNEGGERRIENLVREYSNLTDFAGLDWKKMNKPPVLPSSEQSWLFGLMQPQKALLEVKEKLRREMRREPRLSDLAIATNTTPIKVRKDLEIARAARRKLIKHNLRLVLFVIHKYFPEYASGSKFEDLCQAGVKGLMTAIDRFEPTRKLQLSTIGFFWIRHAVRQYVTLSSFTRVSYGLESVRSEIQRAKLQLSFELKRIPEEEEIISKVGISAKRYQEVMRVSKPVLSLHFRHTKTQEEAINGITEVDDVTRDNWKQPALLRIALDDVLESLKPKESLVIRQRYGLEGKGERTLGDIAGSLNISREMVRKYELKALKKLQYTDRADCLRACIG